MGASTFVLGAEGKSAEETYNKLVEEARRMYGDDMYNGSISTTRGIAKFEIEGIEKVSKLRKKDMKEINNILMKDIGGVGKWGKAGYVELRPSRKGKRFVFFGWAAE